MVKPKTTIAGVNVGKKLGANDIARIQEARPNISLPKIQQKAKQADVQIKPAAQSVFTAAKQVAQSNAQQAELDRLSSLYGGTSQGFGATATTPGETVVPFVNVELAKEAANLQIQKQMEELRQAGSTERQKLVNENNLAVTGMEVKGKLDLQGIINAGYKNIANIERGSSMFQSLMGAFNF